MYRYIAKRVFLVIPTLLGAAVLVFALMRLIPGDICVVRLGSGGNSFDPHAVALCHAEIGLDKPLYIQFLNFVWGFSHGDFGISMWSGKPVATEIAARLPISLEIALLATAVAITIAIPLGTISALKQNTWIDLVVRTIAIGGIATPSFWLGIVSILVVLDVTNAVFGQPWMPPIDYVPIWKDPMRNLSMAILPAITVGYRYAAVSMRMTRSAMLEVMREDYIRTARAKGLIDKIIINRHALKNALAARGNLARHRVRVPDRRPGRDRAGVQFERDRAVVRAGGAEPGLHADPGTGHADRHRLRAVQPCRRSAVRLARSTHPFRLTGGRTMSITLPGDARLPATLTDDIEAARRSFPRLALDFCRRQPFGTFGMAIVLIMAAAGLCAEWIAPYRPDRQRLRIDDRGAELGITGSAPTSSAATCCRASSSARAPLSSSAFPRRSSAAFPGLVLGVASAYFGGRIDMIMQRFFDVMMAFPLIIMALAVVSIFGTGVQNVIIAITIPLIPRCARVVRSSALAIREVAYVDAARACGYGHARIILRHMVPNVMAPFLIMLTAFVGQAILAEASLSYLGLGVQEPVPAWGLMLQGGAEEYASTAPWIAIFPGVAIMLTVFGFSIFGDALRDALDPKLRDR